MFSDDALLAAAAALVAAHPDMYGVSLAEQAEYVVITAAAMKRAAA